MSENQTAEEAPSWMRGRAIWESRSCGDCSNGPPCRCSDRQFMDTLDVSQRECVRAWLTKAAEEGIFL